LRTAIESGAGQALAPLLPKLRYFGDYELLEEIARGGMGVVYRARQGSLARTVAVKMMRPGLLATEAEIRRFQTEARTAASLQHPNIVTIHEVGEFEGLHYFSMEFVEGPSLAALVRQKPLSPAEAARHTRILAEAVQYAHSHGVLHRDLKPSNVLVDGAGRLRITDFGLARPLDGEAGLTATGALLGTPAYMPPEQAAGEQSRLLTGLPPFRGSSQMDIVRQVREEEPMPPRELSPDVDRDLEAICLRCLQKHPAQRYQTAAELAADLDRFLRDEPTLALSHRRGRHVWRWVAAAAALVLVVLMFAILNTRSPRTAAPPAKSAAANPPKPEPAAPSLPAPPRPPRRVVTASVASGRPAPPAASVPSTARAVSVISGRPFILRYTSENGAGDIGMVEVQFHDPASGRGCTVFVEPSTGAVRLQSFDTPGLSVSGEAGSLHSLESPVCIADLSGVSFTKEGNDLEVRLPVSFKPSFGEGPKEITSWPWDKTAKHRSGSSATGLWTVASAGQHD
jgi:predicted Ser/Thr protein kinase